MNEREDQFEFIGMLGMRIHHVMNQVEALDGLREAVEGE